jgi:hypothetical protein
MLAHFLHFRGSRWSFSSGRDVDGDLIRGRRQPTPRPSAARSGITSAEKRYAPPSQTGRSPRPGGGMVTRPEIATGKTSVRSRPLASHRSSVAGLDFCGKRNASRSLDDARCNSSYPHSIRRPASRASGHICSPKAWLRRFSYQLTKKNSPVSRPGCSMLTTAVRC